MPEPHTIHIFVVDGDSDEVKIVHRENWTGWGVAFAQASWPQKTRHPEFSRDYAARSDGQA